MKLPRRKFLRVGASTVALVAAAGCDQMPRELRALLSLGSKEDGPFQPPALGSIDMVMHVLNRAAFGARPGDYEKVRKLGPTPDDAAQAYLQLQLTPDKIDDEDAEYAVRRFETLNEPLGELFEYQDDLLQHELMRGALARAVLSERQLYEVMVQFWSDHFNIDPSKGDCKWLKVADDREVVRKHALGKFPDLLRASALSPAMLWYLDGRVNRRENMADKPNENYARELLELHTLGVHGGYTQKDVMEVARCLTGWTVRSLGEKPNFQIGKVEFKIDQHDFGAKEVLGQHIAAAPARLDSEEREQLGRHELERVLEIVTRHLSTAQHIATKLCRHFIADDPPPGAVTRVADVFSETAGDIPATLRALFETDEFREQRGTKFKRPLNFVVSALRATGARTDASLEIIDYLRRMGHAPFNYPTPEGYPDKAAPWMGTLLWRWNFAVALSENRIKGTRVDFEALRANAGGDTGLMSHLLGRKATQEEAHAYHDSGAGLALLLASPGFQRC
ncbi:MAG TPA: DUF1800 domain-containing protein [Verrucomicrobiae bacterium]|jgi:uncharacterized protein (DUF1800 family)|nr:DUF1800 domain-containing protein [Verrucomicrobiae bacterium]